MGLHDIFVCIDGTAPGDIRFQLALNLAQTSEAHLTTVYALREPRGSAVPPAGGPVLRLFSDRYRRRAPGPSRDSR